MHRIMQQSNVLCNAYETGRHCSRDGAGKYINTINPFPASREHDGMGTPGKDETGSFILT
jgi:hypothetical protein